jgi:glutathione S-transferase
MRFLYHLPLSPYCRKVRLVLGERRLPVELRTEKTWELRPEYLALNPAGTVPTLLEDNGLAIPESSVICEYLEEAYIDATLLGATLAERVETRRLVAWFDGPFAEAVTNGLVREKYLKRVSGQGQPDAGALRQSYANMREHMGYIGWLAETRSFLAGGTLSLADLAAAAHISVLDFLGDIDWAQHPHIREWYARIKSRPSFRSLLNDRIPGMAPPEHYMNLDF